MPYGVQKARTGDPMRWVAERLDVDLGNLAYGSDPANAEDAMEAGIPGNLPPEQIPGKEDLLKGKGRSYYEEDALQQELNELARLAGLSTEGNAFTGKLANTPKGGEFELDGKTFKDTSTSLEEEPNEGNEFSGELAKARAQHKDTFDVDGKEYPVQEADAPVDEPTGKLNNQPKPKYSSVKTITTQGDDLNRQKKQDPRTANKAANPLTNTAMALEAKLQAEYDSIKKISK
jgi:hypothetical protein